MPKVIFELKGHEEIDKLNQFEPKDHIFVKMRADWKCEYCGKDMIDSDSQQFDHIDPTKKHQYDIDNLALSCTTCNATKHNSYNPRKILGPNATRDQMIAATSAYLKTAIRKKGQDPESLQNKVNWINKIRGK